MAYTKQGFENGQVLNASALIAMEDGILGCAPAGYGLGEAKLISMADIDSITPPGWYYSNESAVLGGFDSSRWYIRVMAYGIGTTFCNQEVIPGTSYKCKLVRYKHNGDWGEWEWENPPMSVGVEYRTTERWNGKAVYTKLVNYGGMPAQTTWAVAHGCAATNILRHCAVNETQGMPIPNNITSIVVDKTNITLTNNTPDLKNNQCRVRLWYTKD